jgi:hypothetical protein
MTINGMIMKKLEKLEQDIKEVEQMKNENDAMHKKAMTIAESGVDFITALISDADTPERIRRQAEQWFDQFKEATK